MRIAVSLITPYLAEVVVTRWFRREQHSFAVLKHGRWLDDATRKQIDDRAVLQAIERAHWRQLAHAPPS